MAQNDTTPQQKRRLVLLSLGLALAFGVLSLFASPSSWPHDDWDISLVLSGCFDPGGQINFVNILLGFLIKGLGLVSTTVNWYFWLRWVFTVPAFAVFTYTAFLCLPAGLALTADGLFKFLFWQVCMVETNFTRNAGLWAAAALALLALYTWKRAGRWAFRGGLLFWCMGYLWRPKAALLVAPFALVLILYSLLCRMKTLADWKAALSGVVKNRRGIMALVGCVLITAVAQGAQLAFWSQPEWAAFKSFSDDRSSFVDYSTGGWEKNQRALESAGFTENDYWCMEHQSFADPEFFDADRMNRLADLRAEKPAPAEFVSGQAIPFLVKLPFQVKSFLGFCLVGGILFLLGDWRRRVAILCTGAGSLVICLGLLWLGSLPERVMEAVFAAALFTVVPLGVRQRGGLPGWLRKGGLAAGAVVFLLCSTVSVARVADRLAMPRVNTIENGTTGVQSVDIAATDEEHVYVWNIYSAYNRVQQAYGLTALPERDFFSHNTILGGYHEQSPYMKKSRAAMGIHNPMRALVENENVLLADDYEPERILRYVQQHYEPEAALSSAKDLGDFWALKITPPMQSEERKPIEWEMQPLQNAPTSRSGWYTTRGKAKGLPSDGALWLRASRADGKNRCYRLVRGENGEFSAGLYLDWADPQELTFTLLWQQDGKIMESERLV